MVKKQKVGILMSLGTSVSAWKQNKSKMRALMVWVLERERRAWWRFWVLRIRISTKWVKGSSVGERDGVVRVGRLWKVM